jgi:nitrate/nitrite transporter NarK
MFIFLPIRHPPHSEFVLAAPLGGYLSDRVGSVPTTLAVCFLAAPAVYLLDIVTDVISFGVLMIVI